MINREVNIAILGFGTVGRGTYDILYKEKEKINKRLLQYYGYDVEIKIKKILVRQIEKYPEKISGILCTDYNEILNDDKIDIVVEVIGGVEPATSFMYEAFKHRKNVVSANKKAIFLGQGELEKRAVKEGVSFLYEAAVAGAVPIIKAIKESQISDSIYSLQGIINGSTNYILTRTSNGESLDVVFKEASEQGYLEADPSSDIKGFDAMYKLGILSYLINGSYPREEDIERKGIDFLEQKDFDEASNRGERIKLVAKIDKEFEKLKLSVKPENIRKEDFLYNVSGTTNAISVLQKYSGEMVWVGRGAGSYETGTAVVADIISIARKIIEQREEKVDE